MTFGLTHMLRRGVRLCPNETVTVFNGRRRTYRELADRSARLGAALQKLGMKRGDRVAKMGMSSDFYFEYMMGVWWGGGALNPVNVRWAPAEVAFSLDDCESKILLLDDQFIGLADELKERAKTLETIIYIGDKTPPPGVLHYESLLAENEPIPDVELPGDSLNGVYYTGGTTGFPKGVMLTHEQLVANAIGYSLDLPFDRDEVIMVCTPLFHQSGQCVVNRSMMSLRPTVIQRTFDPEGAMKLIQDEKVTFTLLVPTMVQMIIDHPKFQDYNLSSLRKVLYGASPIAEGVLERMLQLLPNVAWTQGYGMTEMAGAYTVLPPVFHTKEGRVGKRLLAAGRPMFGTELRVVDENDQDVPLGTVGQVLCRGHCLMSGYWKRPEETAAALKDGWMHSGDAGYLDDEGYVYLVDRVKDMIVSGGENVYSSEVESAISKHPAVASCAVIGIPSEQWGEQVHAVIVLKSGQNVTQEEIRAHAKTLIAGYKCPRSVEFRDALPLSPAGKLQKNVLREPFWKGYDRRVR